MASKPDPYVGTRIREYDVLSVIGKGGMGAVYRANHIYLDEERAIKVVHSQFADDEAFVQRFIREAKMLVKLRHRNLVQLFEFGTLGDDIFFMVLELIRGEALLDRVTKKGRLPYEEAVRIIREAALGLHVAHQKDIVHRDISPDNLLTVKEEDGTELTKVIDFGIAKPLADQSRIYTRTNMFLGKPEFCSPEQCGALEEGEDIDHRSDIYSLGVTFYYALTGKLPFSSTTSHGYLHKHITEPPKPISSHFGSGEFPPMLEQIINKTLAKKRDQRYNTMEDFARALEEFTISTKPRVEFGTSSPEVPITDLTPGYLFERRYLIEKTIRKGKKGTFYKALDKILEIPVVLKAMSKDQFEDAKSKERFKRGILLSYRITHPNVCRTYDIGETATAHYVSMEYVDGLLMSDFMRTAKQLASETAMKIIKDLLGAIREAHRQGIIHRNLKPQNIIIDGNHHAHIFDFGSSIRVADVSSTQQGQHLGASTYMAPEQFTEKAIDHKVDLYAIGVMFYELITGTLPFKATSLKTLMFAHLNQAPIKASEVAPGIHPALEKFLMKAIEKDTSQRYASADQMLSDLEEVEKQMTAPSPKPESDPVHTLKPRKSDTGQFKSAFETGKELYDQSRLQEAIDAWHQALVIKPNDVMIQKCISAAEMRLNKETQVRNELNSLFAECEKFIEDLNMEEAKRILVLCEKKITPSPGFREARDKAFSLWKKIDPDAKRRSTISYGPADYKKR